MAENVDDIFTKLGIKRERGHVTEQDTESPDASYEEQVQGENSREYQAFKAVSKPQSRMRIYDKDGRVELISYSYLMRVICTSHQYVSIICTDGVLNFEGRNLVGMIELIQDEKLRSIHCYHAGRYAPVEDDEAVIDEITRISLHEYRTPVREDAGVESTNNDGA